jgi:isoquinoline 1-oxidoreductase alpha subunit
MPSIALTVNEIEYVVEVSADMPLLWVLRDLIGLTGTKYSCGIGECGACTVLAEGEPQRSCVKPAVDFEGIPITTIEGLSQNGPHPLQEAWIEVGVSECGYCQPGQLMTAAALINRNPNPSDEDITSAMNGNLCRCGTYNRIRQAIQLSTQGGI